MLFLKDCDLMTLGFLCLSETLDLIGESLLLVYAFLPVKLGHSLLSLKLLPIILRYKTKIVIYSSLFFSTRNRIMLCCFLRTSVAAFYSLGVPRICTSIFA